MGKFDTCPCQNPKLIFIIFCTLNYVVYMCPHAKFYTDPFRCFFFPCVKLCVYSNIGYFYVFVLRRCLQLRWPHRFWCTVCQKTCFCATMCLFGVRNTKFSIFTPFSPQTLPFLGPLLMGLRKSSTKNYLTVGLLQSKRPIIIVIAR